MEKERDYPPGQDRTGVSLQSGQGYTPPTFLFKKIGEITF